MKTAPSKLSSKPVLVRHPERSLTDEVSNMYFEKTSLLPSAVITKVEFGCKVTAGRNHFWFFLKVSEREYPAKETDFLDLL